MYKLINPITPFGFNTQPIETCDEDMKIWLVETNKCEEENFELIESETTTKKKNK